jgi:peptide-methionine (S)-S-oxide reductase
MTIILAVLLSLNIFSGKQQEVKTRYSMNLMQNTEIATLGSGCFWCTEAVFEGLKGVVSAESGYSGGFVKNPSYREVCNGATGHAEVVQVRFDPSLISYEQILEVFFHTHDPTTLNQQGADVGTQYRSVIFYHNQSQKEIAQKVIMDLTNSSAFNKPIVTQITPFTAFYKAEDYHQDYFAKNPEASYCSYVIRPKIDKFRKNYSDKLKGKPY